VDVGERIELVRRLCSFEGRGPGTDAERRAANELAGRLKRAGRRVEHEPTNVHPNHAAILALHVVIAAGGGLLSIVSPGAGFILVLAAVTSMFGDLNTRYYLLRLLFFRRASQNVISPGTDPDRPARVILCAHYDAARTGMVFGERSTRLARALPPRARLLLGPLRIVFWSAAALVPITGARLAGLEGSLLAYLQLAPTVILIVAIVFLLDIALSEIVPGANDNASGVATVMSVAADLDRDPPAHLDVWVLLTGAEECLMEGMRSFTRRHRRDLDPQTTFFVNVDTVGWGVVHYVVAEGFVVTYDLDRRLAELCEAIADADREGEDRYRARPLSYPLGSDALPPRILGYPSTSIFCLDEDGIAPPWYHTPKDTPDRIETQALERAHGFTLQLVRLLDREIGREIGRETGREAS
jgi:hypothetical protein